MTNMRSILLVSAASLVGLAVPTATLAADQLLSGAIASASGQKLEGVTVSAKRDGTTITTTVYTDETGNYYFPPLPEGKYQVWAQALTFQTGKGSVTLNKTTQQNFVLTPMKGQEDWVRQLPGDEFLAALPADTPEDARMKVQVRKNCTG